MHSQMEIRIVPFNRIQQLSDLYLRIQFLPDLPHQRGIRAFPGLNLSAGKLPPSTPLAIPTPSREDLSVFDNDCRRYFNGFHHIHNPDGQR